MQQQIETTAKTVEEAVAAALAKLGCSRDDVTYEVLEKPKSGFLGLGGAPARVRVTYTLTRAKKLETFLTGLIARMGSSAVAVITEDSATGALKVELQGEALGMLIGRRGDTLDAMQHISHLVVNRGEESPVRVTIDAENYREKREESLKNLAQKMASKVVRSRRSMSLEPMNAYERHVIHTALQDNAQVTTFSTGTDPNRRVVIALARGGDGRPPMRADSSRPHSGYRPGGNPRPGSGSGGRAPYHREG